MIKHKEDGSKKAVFQILDPLKIKTISNKAENM
jgi:hypothetical protein